MIPLILCLFCLVIVLLWLLKKARKREKLLRKVNNALDTLYIIKSHLNTDDEECVLFYMQRISAIINCIEYDNYIDNEHVSKYTTDATASNNLIEKKLIVISYANYCIRALHKYKRDLQ